MAQSAQQLWREKLDFLLAEEARASSPEQKFELQQRIAEARAKLAEQDAQGPPAGAEGLPPSQPTEPVRAGRTGAAPLIVSLWRQRDRQGLLCSGLRLSARHILTVGHAFDDLGEDRPVYVRLIDGIDGDCEARLLQRHRERDAAILELVTAAGQVPRPALLTKADRPLDGQPATLRVVDPDSLGRSTLTSYSIGSFDHDTGEYVIAPDNARGHSGGVVEVDGQVIGLLSRRKTNDPLCRAVAMHLLWPWIRDTLGEPPPTRAAATPVTSIGTVSAAYRKLVENVRARVRERLQRPGTERLARHWGSDPLADFDPADPDGLAALLDGLYVATRDSIPDWRRGPETLQTETKADCRALVSELAKLAVDPDADGAGRDLAAVAASPPERLYLACQFAGTADAVYFALGDLPNLLERQPKDTDIASAQAVHLDDLLPAGQGEDLRQVLLRKLWARVMDDEIPARIDDKQERLLMARIRRHDVRDRRRYLLAAPGPREWLADSHYRHWADSLHLGLVLHEDGQCPYLLIEEPELIDAVREYLQLLETL